MTDYKELYEQAKERARHKLTYAQADEIFPDFFESEDERIRIEIIEHIVCSFNFGNCSEEKMQRWIDWLKKQGEQKPAEWRDEFQMQGIIDLLSGLTIRHNWLKSLKDRYTWKPSNEMLKALYRAIPENVMEKSEDEILLDKLYQGLKYGRVLSDK